MNAPNQSGWRPAMPEGVNEALDTATGNRALMLEELLIFEIGTSETTGVDLPEAQSGPNRLGGLARSEPIGLPGLSQYHHSLAVANPVDDSTANDGCGI